MFTSGINYQLSTKMCPVWMHVCYREQCEAWNKAENCCDVIEAIKRGAVVPYPTPPHNPVPPFKIEPTWCKS